MGNPLVVIIGPTPRIVGYPDVISEPGSQVPISLRVVSEARRGKAHPRARCVRALSIQRLEVALPDINWPSGQKHLISEPANRPVAPSDFAQLTGDIFQGFSEPQASNGPLLPRAKFAGARHSHLCLLRYDRGTDPNSITG